MKKAKLTHDVNSNTNDEAEELDYMSDAFLNSLQDVKPGLYASRTSQRQRIAEMKSKTMQQASLAEQQIQKLNDGLKKQVGPDNKGYGLLAKMGYIPGQGLGKNADGRAEPVGIELLKNREGLGFSIHKQRESERFKRMCQEQQAASRNQFRDTMANRFRYNQLCRQLQASRRICHQLDLNDGIDEPCDKLFWPEIDNNNETDDNQTETSERSCTDKRKLEDDNTFEVIDEIEPVDNDFAKLDQRSAFSDHDRTSKLFLKIVGYLRGQHNYCFWCSAHYESFSELLAQCPGETEDDHG